MIADCGLRVSERRLPIANCKLQIGDCESRRPGPDLADAANSQRPRRGIFVEREPGRTSSPVGAENAAPDGARTSRERDTTKMPPRWGWALARNHKIGERMRVFA